MREVKFNEYGAAAAIVKQDLQKIDVLIESLTTISFDPTLGDHSPQDYYFVDEAGFYIVAIGDRVNIERDTTYQSKEEFLYHLYWHITSNMAIAYAKEHQNTGMDWRRLMFTRQLELLNKIGEEYFNRGKNEIKRILEDTTD